MSSKWRLFALLVVAGGVAAFVQPYVLRRDDWAPLPLAVLSVGLLWIAFGIAYLVELALRSRAP